MANSDTGTALLIHYIPRPITRPLGRRGGRERGAAVIEELEVVRRLLEREALTAHDGREGPVPHESRQPGSSPRSVQLGEPAYVSP
jgi:hypothetical protein